MTRQSDNQWPAVNGQKGSHRSTDSNKLCKHFLLITSETSICFAPDMVQRMDSSPAPKQLIILKIDESLVPLRLVITLELLAYYFKKFLPSGEPLDVFVFCISVIDNRILTLSGKYGLLLVISILARIADSNLSLKYWQIYLLFEIMSHQIFKIISLWYLIVITVTIVKILFFEPR